MPQFSYRARTAQGGLGEGVLDCPDRAVAIRQIEQLHYIPVRIDPVGSAPPAAKRANNGAAAAAAPSLPPGTQRLKIPHRQLLISTEQRGHLLGAGLIPIFITFMVPQLTAFLTQNGGTLPLPTKILLETHHLITGYWWVAGLVVVGAYVGLRAFVRTDEGQIAWDRFRLFLPGYG